MAAIPLSSCVVWGEHFLAFAQLLLCCKINTDLLSDSPCLLNFEKETVNNEKFDVSNILNN